MSTHKNLNFSDQTLFIDELFFRNQGGEMLYARCVELAEDGAYPLKPTPPRAQGLLTEVWQRRKRQK